MTRLLQFNILEGLYLPGGEVPDVERVAAARQLVAAVNPDILVLNEALYVEPGRGRLTDYPGMFGLEHMVGHQYDLAWGNAIVSRFPISEVTSHAFYRRSSLVATLATPEGELRLATYHPHPGRRSFMRATDFETTLSALGTGRPAIISGDFNAVMPRDNPDRAALIEGFRRFTLPDEVEAAVDRFIVSGGAIAEVLGRHGFRDLVDDRAHTIPSDFLSLDKGSAMRIDHVFGNDGIRNSNGIVVRHAQAEWASDHRPVLVDFRIG
jgi:endonuclease/exonuclease/phosphatase family metal-dependent hydrolase